MKPESDITVAVLYPGGRVDRLTDPLMATDMDVAVNPADAYERDILMLDNPDKHIWKPILKTRNRDTKVVYRIRGDMLRAYREMNLTPFKYLLSKYMIGKVDGAISIEPVLAERFSRTTGVSPIGFAGLAKDPDEWPTIEHFDNEIRAITLTNCNYMGKIQPLIENAPVVNEFLDTNGGYWSIYGKGNKSKYLADNLKGYEHIHYMGYADNVKAKFVRHNIMFHFSSFDSLPNAILEGMACNLPVVTNPYPVFTEYGEPLEIATQGDLSGLLQKAQCPRWRSVRGYDGRQTVAERHNVERIGKQYVRFFKELLK